MFQEDQDDHSHVDNHSRRQEMQNNFVFKFFHYFKQKCAHGKLYTQFQLFPASFPPFQKSVKVGFFSAL